MRGCSHGADRSRAQDTTRVTFNPLASCETVIRPATLPKLDNGVEFQVVTMVNRFQDFSSREEPYRVLLFSLCLILDPQPLSVQLSH